MGGAAGGDAPAAAQPEDWRVRLEQEEARPEPRRSGLVDLFLFSD